MTHPRHRLPARNYKGRRAYFLTLCTAERRKHFSDPTATSLIIEVMHQQFAKHKFRVGAYCFMPDHCHILTVSADNTCELAKVVRGFKGAAAAIARTFGIHQLWQRDYYEHIVRSKEDLKDVAFYILRNPLRAGLVNEPGEWLFSGCVLFDWKKRACAEGAFLPTWKSKPQRDKPAAT